jgi:DNA (cytosine-5)-methyltransferase 1
MCLNAGGQRRLDAESETLIPTIGGGFDVTHSLRGEGFDASEDGTGRGTPLVPVHRDIAPTLTSNYGKQPDSSDTSSGPMLIPTIGGGFDGPVGVTLHGTDGTASVASLTDLSSSLRALIPSGVENSTTTAVMQPVAFTQNSRSEVRQIGGDGQVVGALAADAGAQQQNYIAFHPTQDPISSSDGSTHAMGCGSKGGAATVAVALQDVRAMSKAQNGRGWNDDGTAYTVDTHATQGVAVAFPIDTMNHIGRSDNHSFGDFEPGAPSYTLTKGHSHAVAAVFVQDDTTPKVGDDLANCLRRDAGGEGACVLPPVSMQVRRLTPVECERLQGFPDGYTAIPWRKNPASECPDGPRYKALGNSWAVPVVRWIGRRIAEHLA